MRSNKVVVLIAMQNALGVPAVPDPAQHALVVEMPDFDFLDKSLERNNVKPVYGAKEKVNIIEGQTITLTTELVGAGIAVLPDTPGPLAPLFRISGFTEAIDHTLDDESCTYYPHSEQDNQECATIYFYRGGILHAMVDCRCAGPELDVKVNEFPKIKWQIQGGYVAPTDAEIPTPDLYATKPPIFRAAQFAIDDYAAVIESLKIACKGEMGRRPDANSATGIAEYFIKERACTFEVDPETPALAMKNFWDMFTNSDQVVFTAVIGQVKGNRCQITALAAELDKPKYGDRENRLTQTVAGRFIPPGGDPEIEFRFF